MIKLLSRIISALFFIGRSKADKKVLRMRLESWLYAKMMRRKAHSIGSGTHVYGGVNVTRYTDIGDHTCWGKNVKIYGDGKVTIADYVKIGEDTVIYTQNHDYDNDTMIPFGTRFILKPVEIGKAAWIGMRCFILPGSCIGEGAIIQAGSVVHGEIPPLAIAGGNPAKVFAWRNKEHYVSLKAKNAWFRL